MIQIFCFFPLIQTNEISKIPTFPPNYNLTNSITECTCMYSLTQYLQAFVCGEEIVLY